MPSIPLYQRQQTSTPNAPVALASTEAATAGSRALSQFGNQVERVGSALKTKSDQLQEIERIKSEKINKLREVSGLSDYKNELLNFKSSLAEKKHEAMMKKNMPYSEVESKLVEPEIQRFKEFIKSRGYPDSIMQNIESKMEYDTTNIRFKEQKEREDLEMIDYTDRISRSAAADISRGTPEDLKEADAKYKVIEGILGESAAVEAKSLAYYQIAKTTMAQAKQDFSETGDAEKYLSTIKSISTDNMIPNHSETVKQEKLSKLNTAKNNIGTSINSIKRKLQKEMEKGDVSPLTWKAAEALLTPEERTLNLNTMKERKFAGLGPEIINDLNAVRNGDLVQKEFYRKHSDLEGEDAQTAIIIMNEYTEDLLKANGGKAVYENVFRGNKGFKVKNRFYPVMQSILDHAKLIDDIEDSTDYVNVSVKALKKLQEQFPDANEAQIREMNEQINGEKAREILDRNWQRTLISGNWAIGYKEKKFQSYQDVKGLEDARQAPDGNWYVKRDGKYLLVK